MDLSTQGLFRADETNYTEKESRLAGGRPVGYLQAQPRSWARDLPAISPSSGQSGTWTLNFVSSALTSRPRCLLIIVIITIVKNEHFFLMIRRYVSVIGEQYSYNFKSRSRAWQYVQYNSAVQSPRRWMYAFYWTYMYLFILTIMWICLWFHANQALAVTLMVFKHAKQKNKKSDKT